MLVVVRLIQGLSVGGEFSSSVTYLVETAPDGRRGLSGSWANTGSMFGMLLGSGIAVGCATWFTSEQLCGVRRRRLSGGRHFRAKRHHTSRVASRRATRVAYARAFPISVALR